MAEYLDYELSLSTTTKSEDEDLLEEFNDKVCFSNGCGFTNGAKYKFCVNKFEKICYCKEIFRYMKLREVKFQISGYLFYQKKISAKSRAIVVDWMISTQETYFLSEDSLYLAVKLMDLYLNKFLVDGESGLALLGNTALYLAAKYDSRDAPIENILEEASFNRKTIFDMERQILRICGFELSIPLSSQFLRRYCANCNENLDMWCLSYYILEFSLLHYTTSTLLPSKLAAASLYVAMQMTNFKSWSMKHISFTGYTVPELIGLAFYLNQCLCERPDKDVMAIYRKYSKRTYKEVAKLPTIKNEQMRIV